MFFFEEQIEDGPFSIITNIIAEKVVAINYTNYLYYVRNNNSQTRQVEDKNHNTKLPKNAILNAIEIFNNSKYSNSRKEIFEYCILKELAGLSTNVGKNFSNNTRHELCEYCYYVLSTNFPKIHNNKYTRIFALNKLPFSHRLAVKLFLISYRFRVLYQFSLLTSKLL